MGFGVGEEFYFDYIEIFCFLSFGKVMVMLKGRYYLGVMLYNFYSNKNFEGFWCL